MQIEVLLIKKLEFSLSVKTSKAVAPKKKSGKTDTTNFDDNNSGPFVVSKPSRMEELAQKRDPYPKQIRADEKLYARRGYRIIDEWINMPSGGDVTVLDADDLKCEQNQRNYEKSKEIRRFDNSHGTGQGRGLSV